MRTIRKLIANCLECFREVRILKNKEEKKSSLEFMTRTRQYNENSKQIGKHYYKNNDESFWIKSNKKYIVAGKFNEIRFNYHIWNSFIRKRPPQQATTQNANISASFFLSKNYATFYNRVNAIYRTKMQFTFLRNMLVWNYIFYYYFSYTMDY